MFTYGQDALLTLNLTGRGTLAGRLVGDAGLKRGTWRIVQSQEIFSIIWVENDYEVP